MRGAIEGLASPHPLGEALPAVYREDDPLAMRLTEAFDAELAPILATLDSLPAYFDPRLAPEDFLGWLASWVAIELDETWDVEHRRAAVTRAVDLLRRRGTAAGLADELRLATGGEVEIAESGASAWSLDAGSPMVGHPQPSLHVRVHVPEDVAVDAERIDRIIRAAKPAHVPHQVEVLGGAPPASGKRPKAKARAEAALAEAAADEAAAMQDDAADPAPEPESTQPTAGPAGAEGASATEPAADGEAAPPSDDAPADGASESG